MKYNEKELRAIERLTRKANGEKIFAIFYDQEKQDEDIQIVLKLIEKQQKEIENSVSKDKIRELIDECKKEGCCSDELKEYYDNKCVKICRFYEVCTLLRRLVERK